MKEEISVNVTPEREIIVGEWVGIKIFIPLPREITVIKILINKWGENPFLIEKLEKTKEEEYSIYVKFSSANIYDFFFLFYEKGKEKAIKISRETGGAFITEPYVESPYWRIVVKNQLPKWANTPLFYILTI